MNFIEKFGGWVIDNSRYTLPFAMISTFIVVYSSLPELGFVDGKHWECTKSMPEGIKAQCIEYRYKGK